MNNSNKETKETKETKEINKFSSLTKTISMSINNININRMDNEWLKINDSLFKNKNKQNSHDTNYSKK